MSELSKAEKKVLSNAWKETQHKGCLLTEENVQELFEYLEEQLDNTGCEVLLNCHEEYDIG